MILISQKIIKTWFYQFGKEGPDYDKFDLSAIYQIEFEFFKRNNDPTKSSIIVNAIDDIIFGDYCQSFFDNYNYKFLTSPIELIDESYVVFLWQFYIKPRHWWLSKKNVDPSLTLKENKIKEKSVIIASRVTEISQKKIKYWIYPKGKPEPDVDAIDLSKIYLLTIEFCRKNSDINVVSYRAKAPYKMSFGEFIYAFFLNFNFKYPDNPIEYEDDSNNCFVWQFYVKPSHWWQQKRSIDPSLTIEENNIIDADLIVATRISIQTSNKNEINTPNYIINQGEEAVQHYLSQMEKDEGKQEYLFEAKLLVIGEGGTGKTTFSRKIKDSSASMPSENDTTFGININRWSFESDFYLDGKIEKVNFYVNLWDFGGQNIYQGTHQMFFSDKSFYVLVADTRNQKTDFSYWLNTVQQLGKEDSSLIIVLNKKFGHEQKFDEAGYRSQFGKMLKEVITLDLKNDESKVVGLQTMLKLYLMNLPGIGDILPPSWVAIRRDLIDVEDNFISFEKFIAICNSHKVVDFGAIETLSKYFHRIGVFTHYIDDEILFDRIYLNSNWLVKTIYQVIDNEIAIEKQGRLFEEDIKAIWNNNELHFEIKKLAELMNKFGLMYHIPNSNKYIVPFHLPSAMPYNNWEYSNSGNFLHFIYEFDKYMPSGLLSQLVVSLNEHILNHDLVWHRGVNVSSNGAHAEIIESYGGTNRIVIRIAGINKIELLAIIRERFSEVIRRYNKLNFKQLVPCICSECKNSNEPAFHDFNLLMKFRIGDIGSQCQKTGETVSIEELLKITTHKFDNPLNVQKKIIKIFLASSSELIEDRNEFEIFINRENKRLRTQGIFLHLELWEDFIDAMSQTRLQDEYNRVVSECDIFFSMFFTKVGLYTAEEFEKAFKHYVDYGRPIIYTYFKNSPINMNEIRREEINSKFDFEEKLRLMGHFPTIYKSSEDLRFQFKMQLDKIINLL